MATFNTTREVMQALLDGKKVTFNSLHEKYIHIVDDMLVTDSGESFCCVFGIENNEFYSEYLEE